MSVSCLIINHKRDINFPFTQKKVVHFDTLFFSFIIKNLLKHLASISILYSRDKPRQQLLTWITDRVLSASFTETHD